MLPNIPGDPREESPASEASLLYSVCAEFSLLTFLLLAAQTHINQTLCLKRQPSMVG